ncbi:hypothetical protein RRG08_047654 [Elysia crispata]|uniref:Uncharacterized protein n=1 Tax=Elysia crispata TaxID=231223 RepID=A0AAE0ZW35_9GAST|nr:hypothetical protein RRG08_047654 [Elysia crispata]
MQMCLANWYPLLGLSLLFYETRAVYECKAGTWGAQCGKRCGQCMGGGEFCQVFDGHCMNGCASGYTGTLCKQTCPKGRFGPYCGEKCGNCTLSPIECDTVTGHCIGGCKPGYQPPFCKIPCQFNRFGKDCVQKCECTEECGCDPVTGNCIVVGCNPGTVFKYRKESSTRQCINQYALRDIVEEYAPPDVLEIPWRSMLSVIGLLVLFVLSNFIWWWFCVRTPPLPSEDVVIDRSQKPEYMAYTQEERGQSLVLAHLRRKMAAEEAARAEAERKAKGIFSLSLSKLRKTAPAPAPAVVPIVPRVDKTSVITAATRSTES